ncbi:hypothetical protein HOY34_11295 [Xinfangfangia sp. D13-10-4-6]|uniref:hypothetical protein n=1 Tax=Pseudogemmobacter hezensis TaxID=2737662 RepID=UPI0015555675|nr:hypothetical protein [Pseudogemmobacter hezensis]NPD15786.1 hypothetical protein [Pseudogemmobacter hezensis]
MTALRWLWKPAALLLALLAAWWRGRSGAKQQAAAKDAAAYQDTMGKMTDVQDDHGAVPDDARRWLRERPPHQR